MNEEDIICSLCRGTGKVVLKKDGTINSESDDVISISPGWFEECENLQNKIEYHMYLLKNV